MLFKTVLQFLTAKLMLLKNAKFQDFISHGLFFLGSFQYYDVKCKPVLEKAVLAVTNYFNCEL